MGKKMFVGGLPYEVTESQLSEMFAVYGKVVSAKVIKDRDTGLSKGFGFVEMGSDAEAAEAIAKLNSSSVGSRRIIVNEARPMEPRAPGSFEKKSFGPKPGFGDKPSFGDGPGFGDKRGGRGDKRGGFGGKKGGKGHDDDGDSW